jgi:hypothetical protein
LAFNVDPHRKRGQAHRTIVFVIEAKVCFGAAMSPSAEMIG